MRKERIKENKQIKKYERIKKKIGFKQNERIVKKTEQILR